MSEAPPAALPGPAPAAAPPAVAAPPTGATGGLHRVSFRGAVDQRPLAYQAGDLVLLDAAGAALAPPPPGVRVVEIGYPPHREVAEAASGLLLQHRPVRLVAAGDGATLDVAKHTWRAGGAGPELVLAPVGAEPWRAFAPFTSLYEPVGGRVSRRDRAFGTARVVLDEALLAARPAPVVARHRADSIVHGLEVLLHTGAGDWARALAGAGLAAVRGGAGAVIGAGLITEAFCGAGLGLAHALASPLGAAAGRTHDVPNVILAPYVVRHYGDRVDWTAVAAGLGTGASAAAVADALDGWRERAGLPDSLRACGFSLQQARGVVPAALRSSGVPYLPVPTGAAEVADLLERAWAGR